MKGERRSLLLVLSLRLNPSGARDQPLERKSKRLSDLQECQKCGVTFLRLDKAHRLARDPGLFRQGVERNSLALPLLTEQASKVRADLRSFRRRSHEG